MEVLETIADVLVGEALSTSTAQGEQKRADLTEVPRLRTGLVKPAILKWRGPESPQETPCDRRGPAQAP